MILRIYLLAYYKLHFRYYLPVSKLHLWLKSKGIPFFRDGYLLSAVIILSFICLISIGIAYENNEFKISGTPYANLYIYLTSFVLVYLGMGL